MTKMQMKYRYHDGYLKSFSLGPRREMTLTILLPGESSDPSLVMTRFGAIENFEEIKSFCENLPSTESDRYYIDEIIRLELDKSKASTAKKMHFLLELDHEGSIPIICGKFNEQKS